MREVNMNSTNKAYYQKVRNKVEKYEYTIMSVVSNYPRSEDHAAYCYTIGLSNYGLPEVMLADCDVGDIIKIADLLTGSKPLSQLRVGDVIHLDCGAFKSIELLNGVKEQLTEQAREYFKMFRPDSPDFELVYMGKADELGLYPDEKVFEETEVVKQVFFKVNAARLAMSETTTIQ
ncbi:MAG: hypothetical protein CML20_07275 [Rheinheimera sp.]|nr:hypothetical protein [Rheinheimera sp.]